MKDIKFSPLRRIKKSGKITVAGYMQWRKLMTADYSEFNLVIGGEHLMFGESEFVYNHKGEQLFFYDFNPEDIPIYNNTPMLTDKITEAWHYNEEFPLKTPYGIDWGSGNAVNYNCKGMDCDGVPNFSHNSANYIGIHYENVKEFVPLTVKIVNHWYGWILYRLKNSNLIKL